MTTTPTPASQQSTATARSRCDECGEHVMRHAWNCSRHPLIEQSSPALDLTDYSTCVVQTNTAAIAALLAPARSDKDAAQCRVCQGIGRCHACLNEGGGKAQESAPSSEACKNENCEGGFIYSTAHTLRMPCPDCAALARRATAP